MTIRDIRTPADPQDQQSTDSNTALPPAEFTVAKGTTFNLLMIQDRQGPQDRVPTVSYRVYFMPAAFAPTSHGTSNNVPHPVVMGTEVRAAGRNVASLVADIKAPALGTVLSINDPVNFGKAGYYYCVGVNRISVEAPPEHMVAAP
jgi:hypothetical protein